MGGFLQLCVVTGPGRRAFRPPFAHQMPNSIPIRIEQADLGDGAERDLALPTGFSKHVLGSENGGFLIIPAVIERRAR